MRGAAVSYFAEHPRALRVMSVGLVGCSLLLLLRSVQVDALVSQYMRDRASDAARARSEALGG